MSVVASLAVLVASFSACSPSSSTQSSPTSQPSADVMPMPLLWGEMKPIVSVKELMRDLLDPLADNIFDAVSIVVDKNGTVEHVPTSDEDWERIRVGALAMAEGVYPRSRSCRASARGCARRTCSWPSHVDCRVDDDEMRTITAERRLAREVGGLARTIGD